MEEYDVTIIGASISGSRVASLVSKDCNTVLIEEHRKIGLPLQCSGLVSYRLLDLLPNLPKEIILNKVKSAKFFSPNGNCLELKPNYPVYVIDRVKLDRFLFDKAEDRITVKSGEKFEEFKCVNDSIMIKTNKEAYYSKILVGADGPNSAVRRQLKIKDKNSVLGLQTTVKGEFDSDSVELWFGSKVCPNLFAWVVPIDDNLARVGLATNRNVMRFYNSFLKKRIGYLKKPDVVGKIPYGLINRTSDNRVILVGDAAFQAKPFSGGGIIYGLTASEICANACIKSLEENKFNRKLFNIIPDAGLDFLFYSAGHSKKFLESWDMDLL